SPKQAKGKALLPYLLQKHIYHFHIVALNFYRSNISLRTMTSLRVTFLCYVIYCYHKSFKISHTAFYRDYIHKWILDMKFINIDEQLTDIFTKLLLEDKLIHIRNLLGMTLIKERSLKFMHP
ncbi:hypothetical protein CR513_52304, partial [Mucuna pruriens]